MKFKCLVLDHDDTAVDSTPTLHYPAFCKIMEELRPESRPYTLHDFNEICFSLGFVGFCRQELHFSDEEMRREYNIWRSYVDDLIPEFVGNMREIIREFKERGGVVAVVSHSDSTDIINHYKSAGILPDIVYGSDRPENEQKPYPFPLRDIERRFGILPEDMIVVDDLKPGYDMAKACGAVFAAAGWAHEQDCTARRFFLQRADFYLNTTEELEELLFEKHRQGTA